MVQGLLTAYTAIAKIGVVPIGPAPEQGDIPCRFPFRSGLVGPDSFIV